MILISDAQLATLLDFRYQQNYSAKRGQHGRGKNQEGRSAPDRVVPVPVGTLVWEAETGKLLKDFVRPGETFCAARGGRGGRGNARFATATRQAPRHSEPGRPGEEHWLRLELKLLADVGIIGFPNAGKSTLISRISAARPKIADYPFTTLVPQLGIVSFGEHPPFVIADIPGIIEGAHEGSGLGLKFLRHVERTAVLLHLLDLSAPPPRDPLAEFATLNRELALFNPALARKPQVVALNKMDMPEAGERLSAARRHFRKLGQEVYPVSALTGEGLPKLLGALVARLPKEMPEEKEP